MRRGGVLLALWVVVAFTAIGVGTWALSLVGGEINDQAAAPLSSTDIDKGLNADRVGQGGGHSSDPSPTGTAGRTGQGAAAAERPTRGLSTDGGSVRATCRGTSADLAYLETWNPALGYRVDGVLRGPARTASIVFESDVKDDLLLTVRCVNGMPTKDVKVEADDHGGGRHRGGSDDATTASGGSPATPGGTSGGTSGGSGSGGGSSGGSPAPTPTPTDDHGGHGTDDPPGDDHGGRTG
jgi:hypothetical protein